MNRLITLILLLAIAPSAMAQSSEVVAPRVVMNLAAHPDDEDALTMAYYRHAKNAVVHSVIYTRGEGGQNEIGPELYAALGAIRSNETEAAARHYGTQVRFLNFDDFGYSKHASETFARWGGEEEVTARLVYLIRRLKPDVLFTNHDTLTVGPRVQHGHHQAVGISAYRAMQLAADPSFRPEQLEEDGVDLWQPQRLFLRLWRGGQDTAVVRVPVGDYLPSRGESATDIAVRGIAEHRSQGFDLFAPRFRQDTTHFALLAAAPGAPPVPRGATALDAGLPANPHAARIDLPHLIDSDRAAHFPPGSITLMDSILTAGDVLRLRWNADPGDRLVLSGLVDTTFSATGRVSVNIPPDARPTLPRNVAQYDRMVNHPPIQAALYDGDGRRRYAQHLGVEIAPDLTLEIEETVVMPGGLPGRVLLPRGGVDLTVTGRSFDPDAEAIYLVAVIRNGDDEIAKAEETVRVNGGDIAGTVRIELPPDLAPGAYAISLTGQPLVEGGDAAVIEREGHVLPEVTVPDGLRVGFVRSYDATTENALRRMGVDVIPLDSLALAHADFDGLHTIVVDIRGYLARHDLRAHNDRLLEWVENGGHLVVTYQKTFEWNEDHADPFIENASNPPGFAPFSLRLGRDRVTREDAPVTIREPQHPLFTSPNIITDDDWQGWIQERGLYFPARYDDAFMELLAMADPGEEPLHSSTLLARHGQGTYFYSALGWYRQLGAFVPGAYRMFANIVSLPLVDGRTYE